MDNKEKYESSEWDSLLKLKVSEFHYSVEINIIQRPFLGEEPNYILISEGGNEGKINKWEKKLSNNYVSDIFKKLNNARIPLCGTTSTGFDEISYEITFNQGSSTFRWCGKPPQGWEILGEIASKLYYHSGRKGYKSI